MPFKSQSQMAFMFIHHPEIAKRWADEYPGQHDLPEHVKQKRTHIVEAMTAMKKGR